MAKVTSFSVDAEAIEDLEWMVTWCKTNGRSKSWLITKLIRAWVAEKKLCTT